MYKYGIINPHRNPTIITLSTIIFVFIFSTTYGQVYAQSEENVTTTGPSFLFIQSAQSGSLSQINDTTYSIELNDVAEKTISYQTDHIG